MSGRLAWCTAALAAVLVFPAAAQQPPVNPTGAVVAAFQKRLAAYLSLRDKADAGIPAVKHANNAQEIAEREKALNDAIRTTRVGAKQGEIFGEDIAPLIRKIITADYRKRTAQEKKNLLDEHQEFDNFVPKANQTYPTTVTLATFPATLLAALPPLPDKLEYRLVRNTLVLRDSYANLIVDVLPKVY